MRFLKTKIFILLLIVASGATFYYFGDTDKLISKSIETLEKTPLKGVVQGAQNISKEKVDLNLEDIIKDAEEEISKLSSRAAEVKEHTDNILGDSKILESSTDATGNEIPIHEKTLEYGKYMYCKLVVDDYEDFNSLN